MGQDPRASNGGSSRRRMRLAITAGICVDPAAGAVDGRADVREHCVNTCQAGFFATSRTLPLAVETRCEERDCDLSVDNRRADVRGFLTAAPSPTHGERNGDLPFTYSLVQQTMM